MQTFEYQALDAQGKTQKGVIEADSERVVRKLLRDKSLIATDVEPVVTKASGTARSSKGIVLFKSRVKSQDLMMITRQLATLVGAGMPLEQCLGLIGQQSDKPRIRRVISSVRSGVAEGYSFARALRQASMVFPEEYIATIAAAEETGHMHQVLERLADDVESQQQTNQSLTSALVYPLVMILVAIAVVVLLMVYVVPKVTEVYAGKDKALPLLTHVLVTSSDFVIDYGVVMLLVLSAVVALFLLGLRKPGFLFVFHKNILHLPLFGSWIMAASLSRWARSLSMLMQSGVSSLESLKIAQESVRNVYLKKGLVQATAMVREGKSLHKALNKTHVFPGFMIHMVAGGEASGNLHHMLLKVAEYYAQHLKLSTQLALKLLEPLLIVVMGGLVLLIVMAILMPIFQMNELVL